MPAAANQAQDPGLPAIYLHIVAELLHSRGFDEQHLIHQVGLDAEQLGDSELRVSLAQAREFVTRAIIESGEPGLGILLANESQLLLHGAMGEAVINSETLRDALDIMVRYLTLRAPFIEITAETCGRETRYRIESKLDPGPLRNFFLDAVLFSSVRMGVQLNGRLLPGTVIERRGPEPAYFRRLQSQVRAPVRFDAPCDALILPTDGLAAPIRHSDRALAAVSRGQCEQALSQLSETASLSARVKRIVETGHPFPPKLAQVAGTLFMSERTLKRRLHDESSSFQILVDEVRLERSRELLNHTDFSLGHIAESLGYADSANFTRAFKRWTGVSPSAWRSGRPLLPQVS